MDQQSTLFPPPPTAFASYGDVVDRLLPYHIWQIHDEELESSGGEERERERQRKGELCGPDFSPSFSVW
jgi:hypothetical protein